MQFCRKLPAWGLNRRKMAGLISEDLAELLADPRKRLTKSPIERSFWLNPEGRAVL